jgi:hypothetical protein
MDQSFIRQKPAADGFALWSRDPGFRRAPRVAFRTRWQSEAESPVRVKMGNPQSENLFSGLDPIADTRPRAGPGR